MLLLLLSINAVAQPSVGIGNWESFISYNNSRAVAASDNVIFAANELSISSYNLDDYTLRIYNKITGLSDMGISTIAFNKAYNTLIVAYSNGNLDLMKTGGRVLNKPAIRQNTIITGDKSVKHIFCDSNMVYLSTDFGLVNFDMELEEFGFTTFTPNVKVKASARRGDTLFISSDKGIYSAALSLNLLDFNSWTRSGISNGILNNTYESRSMILMADKLYADVNDTIMVYNNGGWAHLSTLYTENNSTLPFCYSGYENLKMQINPFNTLISISTGSNFSFLLSFDDKLIKQYFDPQQYGNVNDALLDRSTTLWTANDRGMHRLLNTGSVELVSFAGPYTNRISDMAVSNFGSLWCAGATRSLLGPQFDRTGAYRYINRNWTNFNDLNNTELSGIYDINSVAVHPKNKSAYFGSLMSGIIRITADDSIQITDALSPGTTLTYATGNAGVTRVAGLAFDEDENLWIANNLT